MARALRNRTIQLTEKERKDFRKAVLKVDSTVSAEKGFLKGRNRIDGWEAS